MSACDILFKHPVTLLTPDTPDLHTRLSTPESLLVACLCADWCGTCREYQPKFAELSARFPQCAFVWIDIEEHSEFVGDEDIENFPTLLIQSAAGVAFYGPMLPHIGHLERLLTTITQARADEYRANGPDVLGLLRQAQG